MRFRLTGLLVVLTGVALTAQQPFRAGTRIVSVMATVTDAERRLVPDLERQDFTVLDNGKPQELSVFQNEVTPFSVVVMLDTSASMTANLDLLNQAAEQFLIRLLPADRGQVGAFNDKIQLSGTFTNDRDDLIGALDDLQFGNPTRLYDAIDHSMEELEKVDGRRVVLVFTDGDDTASRAGLGGGRRRNTKK
jgi:Ca-activated chloride channel family protein